jgi:hypothetical protein
MYAYRFRAECRVDVEVLMSILPDAIYQIRQLDISLPDVQVDMTSHLDLSAVKAVLSQVPDCQVMLRTIAYRDEYRDTFDPGPDSNFSQN